MTIHSHHGLAMLDAANDIENRRLVAHETFGHLYPEDTEVHRGTITFYYSEYGSYGVLSEDVEGISDSPWWMSSMNEFIDSFILDEEGGTVWKLHVEAQSVPEPSEWDDEEERFVPSTESRIHITEVKRERLI